ncbi:MAG: 2,3-bisphosphoglycerate-independent phosphoglycerate mutase, partial [Phascolarctobacterium sp.]|nr:2,3-bisphosphoglycerate-independent phosphoglycerate mutase [Phascolarctobacterium sp.]
MSKEPVLLMILDGWGIGKSSADNAAFVADTPNLDRFFAEYPHTELNASGGAVGLPDGQMGNSEVGHLNIGSGRIIYQELTRITEAIKNGSFFKNPVLLNVMEKTKAAKKSLHLLGLLSDGGVHSHIDHLIALLRMAKQQGLEKVFVHAFLDGRDAGPKTAANYFIQLENAIKEIGIGRIATVSGRCYAMDRDKRWDRTEKAYNAMVRGEGKSAVNAVSGVESSYADGVTDEFVVPFLIDGTCGKIASGDGVIFFNFRPDRARQITRALNDADFTEFERVDTAIPVNFVCMPKYDVTISATVAFPPESYEDNL